MQRNRIILLIDRMNLALGALACMGIAQFGISIFWAIASYDHYSLTENFLSDLGRVRVNGVDNTASASVFNRSLVILGLSLIPFFVVIPAVVERFQSGLRISGVISALGVMGLGLTPYDRYGIAHIISLVVWIGAFLFMAMALAVNVGFRGIPSMACAGATFALFMCACGYVLGGSHVGHVVYQKLLVLAASMWIGVTVIVVSISTHKIVLSRQRMIVDNQARRYLQLIERGDWRRK